MKLLVLGATGPTGRQVVDLALQSGDAVTAFVRNPAALGDLASGVRHVTGDATSQHDVFTATVGQDIVVSALGLGNSLRPRGFATRSAAAVVGAATKAGVSRLVWLSSFGVGHTLGWSSVSQKLIYGTLLRSLYADKNAADDQVRASGLDWTVVYPTKLTNDGATGVFRAADDRLRMKGVPTISRADVAAFLYQAALGSEWIKRNPVISE